MSFAPDPGWLELLQTPAPGHHFVQIYADERFLSEAVSRYAGSGLARGEAVMLVATPAHRTAFLKRLDEEGLQPGAACERGQLAVLDAEDALERVAPGGLPDWQRFHELIGVAIAQMRLSWPAVRAYGELVDVLWQDGRRDAAIRLEEFWNDLAKLQTFSLLCGYRMDPLDPEVYGGPLECVCKSHTHLIPASDYEHFNQAVLEACREVFEPPLAHVLRSAAASPPPVTTMPEGLATLLWLRRNMPRAAESVLAVARARAAISSPSPGEPSPAPHEPFAEPPRAA